MKEVPVDHYYRQALKLENPSPFRTYDAMAAISLKHMITIEYSDMTITSL